ncbi:MAG: hypothetical protein ACRD8Z_29000 [Nitrososphaeraceae archaeon]
MTISYRFSFEKYNGKYLLLSWDINTNLIAISSDSTSIGQQFGDGGQILISRTNLIRKQYY